MRVASAGIAIESGTSARRIISAMTSRDDIVRQIDQAFQDAAMPRTESELTEGGGLDGPYVVEHFLGKARGDVDSTRFLPSLHMEDFTYMTQNAVAYYLPSVLKLMLVEPYDADLWIFLGGFLRSVKASYGVNLHGLSASQRKAIADWADFLRQEWEPTWDLDPREATKLALLYHDVDR